ncbi:protein-tyrosine phosphatase-like protein [Thamnidium elegans]|nr:protein-tyrosine phosphatase-like protein [Thamnidium elegans]
MISQQRSPLLGRMLSLIEMPSISLRFLILDCPTESTLPFYLEEFKKYNITHIIRCCQPTYNTSQFTEQGIQVHDLPFKDGGVPPPNVVTEWLSIVDREERDSHEKSELPTIAVHCVAGLGRAPALVAIALIELGMQPLDAVEFIRRKRRGAFNKPQIAYLDNYKRTLRTKSSSIKISFSRMFRFGSKKEVNSIPVSGCV